ncbi:MAG TPA: ATP-binding cassette domain-containing protein [Planctomycetota bacterium]|nr:ATP-binding cassette domain-containing protein [Planctomycetota bacterium]
MAAVPLIELQDVHKAFGAKAVLRGTSLRVEPGETLVVLGRSGSGKSVTLKTIVGLLRPDSGRVRVGEVDVTRADRQTLSDVRRRVAYVFQTGALVNWLTVRENVALPLVERRELRRDEIRERVEQTLTTFQLLEAADQYPDRISGGMRKRAALCRVLVQEPAVILYDEPTAGLDPILSRTVAEEIVKAQAGARSALVVTHDLDLAFAVADRIALHHEGRLIEAADPATFQSNPHPAVREFLDARHAPPRGEPA